MRLGSRRVCVSGLSRHTGGVQGPPPPRRIESARGETRNWRGRPVGRVHACAGRCSVGFLSLSEVSGGGRGHGTYAAGYCIFDLLSSILTLIQRYSTTDKCRTALGILVLYVGTAVPYRDLCLYGTRRLAYTHSRTAVTHSSPSGSCGLVWLGGSRALRLQIPLCQQSAVLSPVHSLGSRRLDPMLDTLDDYQTSPLSVLGRLVCACWFNGPCRRV